MDGSGAVGNPIEAADEESLPAVRVGDEICLRSGDPGGSSDGEEVVLVLDNMRELGGIDLQDVAPSCLGDGHGDHTCRRLVLHSWDPSSIDDTRDAQDLGEPDLAE